jgi:predicted metal-dependent hydrolase
MDNQGNIIIKNENKIIIKHKEIKNDQDHYLKRYIKKYKNEKNIEIIKERLIIYSDFILNFKEFFL